MKKGREHTKERNKIEGTDPGSEEDGAQSEGLEGHGTMAQSAEPEENSADKSACGIENGEIRDATPKEVRSLLEKALSNPEGPIFLYKGWCKRCGVCVEFCPRKVYDWGDDGYPCVAFPEKCTSCYLCEYRCPDFAITLLKSRK